MPLKSDAAHIGLILQNTIVALPATNWLPEPKRVTIQPLADGVYHANFTVESGNRRSVIRVVRQSQWGLSVSDQLLREHAVLEDLIHTEVAPRPLALVKSGPIPFTVESLIRGEYVNHSSDLVACAVAFAAVHTCTPTRSRHLLDQRSAKTFLLNDSSERLKNCRRSARWARSVTLLARALHMLAATDLPSYEPTLIHTDLIQKNLLVNGSKCGIVDWEGARIGCPAWDLAYFLSPVTLGWADPPAMLDDHERMLFLRAYSDETKGSVNSLYDDIASFMPFVLLRQLSWCVNYAYHEFETESSSAQSRLGLFTSPEFISSTFKQAGLPL